MDWAAMTAVCRIAEKAATLSERTVGGVAEMLQRQHRHSSDLSGVTKVLAVMDARLYPE
jgi:hypothetical protein